jgi:hypothetical protein
VEREIEREGERGRKSVCERGREKESGGCHRAMGLQGNNTKQTVKFIFRIEPFVD